MTNRDNYIMVKVTKEEKEKIAKNAETFGMKVSSFVRFLALKNSQEMSEMKK